MVLRLRPLTAALLGLSLTSLATQLQAETVLARESAKQ